MECKVHKKYSVWCWSRNWNISRMECKEHHDCLYRKGRKIGIYPEWNVKAYASGGIIEKPTYWNISRMECKGVVTIFINLWYFIGIYPEWNVKLVIGILAILFILLEYIQNGM